MSEDPVEWVAEAPPNAVEALLVKDGKVTRVKLNPDSDDIRVLIGNWFVLCFSVSGQDGLIQGLCDDEFLLKTPEEVFANWNVILRAGNLYRVDNPIGGPIVIIGVDSEGETRSLSDREMDSFYIRETAGALIGDGKGDVKPIPALLHKAD